MARSAMACGKPTFGMQSAEVCLPLQQLRWAHHHSHVSYPGQASTAVGLMVGLLG